MKAKAPRLRLPVSLAGSSHDGGRCDVKSAPEFFRVFVDASGLASNGKHGDR